MQLSKLGRTAKKMDKKKYCPEISDCSQNHNVDTIKCFEGYELCHEYVARQENRKMQSYGVPLGIGAITFEGLQKLLEEQDG